MGREISIHALLTESDHGVGVNVQALREISIHALLTESDVCSVEYPANWEISIHALLTESDPDCTERWNTQNHFNPRSPHGERRQLPNLHVGVDTFQSTLSSRRATPTLCRPGRFDLHISIHALLTESDAGPRAILLHTLYFNPRSPHGERRLGSIRCRDNIHNFNPRSPHGERLFHNRLLFLPCLISIHALLTESDTVTGYDAMLKAISIHALLTESDRRNGETLTPQS